VEGPVNELDLEQQATVTDDDGPFLPRKVDISLCDPKFRPAYIEVVEDPTQSDLDIPFVSNLSNENELVAQATAPGRHAPFVTNHDYWTVQIVTGYQGPTTVDHDPDAIYHAWTGVEFKIGDTAILLGETISFALPVSYDNVSVVFIETIRDAAAWSTFFGPPPWDQGPVLDAGDVERVNVVHELGHNFGISGEPHPPSGIMQEDPTDTALEFTGEDLAIIRNSMHIGDP
jgi:hypothetical protein